MCLALKVKKFEFWRAHLGGTPQFLLSLVNFYNYPLRKFDPSSFRGLKLQNSGGPD